MRKTLDLGAAVRAAAEHKPAQLTLKELVDACALALLNRYDQRLRKWTAAFGHKSAWSIKSDTLEIASQHMLSQGYKPSSVNRDLSALGTVYRWAKKRRLHPRGFRSPTLSVRRYPEDIRRVEVGNSVLDALRARSLATRDRRFGVFVWLLIDTGARKSELLERRWAEVDLARGQILCPTTKTGVPRVLHFRPETAALVERVYKSRPDDGLVFEGRQPGSPISFRAAWRALVNDLGRPDLHMHDMRHARAAALLRSGVSLPVAAQVMGHDAAVLTRRYGHLDIATMRQAQEVSWRS